MALSRQQVPMPRQGSDEFDPNARVLGRMPPQMPPGGPGGGTTMVQGAGSPPLISMPGQGYKGGPLPPSRTGDDIPMPVYGDMPPISAMPLKPGTHDPSPYLMPPMRGGGGPMPVPGPDGGPTQIQDWGGGMWHPPVGVGAMPGVAGGWGGAMPIMGAPGGNMMPPSMGRDTLMPLPPGGFPGMPPVLEPASGLELLPAPPNVDPKEWAQFLEERGKVAKPLVGPGEPPSMGREDAPARGLRRMAPKEPVEEVPVETGRDRRRRSRIPPQPPAQKPGAGGKKPKIGGAGGRTRGY